MEQPALTQTVLLTFAAQFTLFWLWNLALLYLGGRHALNGRRVAALLVVVAWVLVLILVPSVLNQSNSETPPALEERPMMEPAPMDAPVDGF